MRKLAQLVKRLSDWMQERSRMADYKLFVKLYHDVKSNMKNVVVAQAMEMARVMCMNWLDSKNIIHCKNCPITEPLKKIGDAYFCTAHLEADVAPSAIPAAKEPALKVVKP